MGGNIGTAILSLEPPRMGRVHVIEMSSYQIDLAPSLDPSVGILLNVSEDHIDRHGTLEHYAAVKERLVAGVQPQGTSIVGVDDGWCRNIADRLDQAGKRVVRISVKNPLPDGIYVERETIVQRLRRRAPRNRAARRHRLAARPAQRAERGLRLGLRAGDGHRDRHVCRTACAAFPVWRTAWSRSAAAATCCSSTTPRAPMRMRPRMRCRPSPTSSGSPAASRKLGGITGLTEYFPRIRKAYLIGEAAQEFAGTLGERVPHEIPQTLDVAVANAARDAEASGLADPVVLLSPACASFDQYRNFEIRGTKFPRSACTALPGVKPVAVRVSLRSTHPASSSSPAQAGDPVFQRRRLVSGEAAAYWIPAFAGMTIPMWGGTAPSKTLPTSLTPWKPSSATNGRYLCHLGTPMLSP